MRQLSPGTFYAATLTRDILYRNLHKRHLTRPLFFFQKIYFIQLSQDHFIATSIRKFIRLLSQVLSQEISFCNFRKTSNFIQQ